MSQIKILGFTLLLAAFAWGCTGSESSTADAAPADDTAADAPAESEPAETATADAGPEIAAPGAVFNLPANWIPEQPESNMRLYQAQIPGSGGPGRLTVFHFPGGGGGVDANLQRWEGQVQSDSESTRDSFALGDWQVTWVEVEGTLMPSMGGPTEPQPDSRLLGAVVEGQGGPWFFKATGPSATLDEQRDAFLGLLKSGRPN